MKPYRRLLAIHDGECRWIVGDPQGADTLMCGDPTIPGKSYCERHCAVVYRPDAERDKANAAEFRYLRAAGIL
jgi:GcrA cell cycle regulator